VLRVKCLHPFLFERGAGSSRLPNSAARGLPREGDGFAQHTHRAKPEVILGPLGNERTSPDQSPSVHFGLNCSTSCSEALATASSLGSQLKRLASPAALAISFQQRHQSR
jgi:hypothetical protein